MALRFPPSAAAFHHSLTHSLPPSLTHSLTLSLTPSLPHSLTHSLALSAAANGFVCLPPAPLADIQGISGLINAKCCRISRPPRSVQSPAKRFSEAVTSGEAQPALNKYQPGSALAHADQPHKEQTKNSQTHKGTQRQTRHIYPNTQRPKYPNTQTPTHTHTQSRAHTAPDQTPRSDQGLPAMILLLYTSWSQCEPHCLLHSHVNICILLLPGMYFHT